MKQIIHIILFGALVKLPTLATFKTVQTPSGIYVRLFQRYLVWVILTNALNCVGNSY